MNSIGVRRARALIAAIGLAVAMLAIVDAQGSASAAGQVSTPVNGVASQERSVEASEVEAAVAGANLSAKLEAALGGDFGGVWFEPATAQLYVGVTSAQARLNAEAVAAQAGLSEDVVETRVSSSWPQLEAAQERWSHRLADLFERGEVSTGLVAESNSLDVMLSSSVPTVRRQALERAAAGASVGVEIEAATPADLRAAKGARCLKFEKFKAFCDPTIVAGTGMDGPKPEKGSRATCTAGPAVITKTPTTKSEATDTYLLTAGHCIESAGGSALSWFGYNKEGEPKGENEIGPAGVFLNGETDVGIILIEKTYWARANNIIPVIPTVAQWSAAAEVEPTAVESQGKPAAKGKTCLSGQRSGKVCGEIKATGVEFKFEGEPVATKNLVEVELTGKAGKGDSGGPFYSESKPGVMEGTFVGFKFEDEKKEEGKIVFFQPLETSFEKLEKEKTTSLKLLTQANEKRHPKLKAGKFPVTIHGTSTSQKFITEAGTIECKSNTFHAVASESSSTLTVTPEYKECKTLGVAATVNMEGCTYVVHVIEKASADNYRAESDISCPEGKSIKVSFLTCKAEIKSQTGRETIDLIDNTEASPKKDISVRPTVTGIAYTVTQDEGACPFNGTGAKTGGEYTSGENTTLTGQSTTVPEEKIAIEIADE